MNEGERDVRIERVINTNRNSPEVEMIYSELDVSRRAIKIANSIKNIAAGVDLEASRKYINTLWMDEMAITTDPSTGSERALGFGKYSSLGLKDFKGMVESMPGKPPAGLSESEKADFVAARGFYYDLIDGLAIGSMWGRNLKEVNNLDVGVGYKGAIADKASTVVEEILGLDSHLNGIGEVIISSAITDKDVLDTLDLMQMTINRNGANNDPTYYSRWVDKFVKIAQTSNNPNIMDDVEMVISYLSSLEGGSRSERIVISDKEPQQRMVANECLSFIENAGLRFGDLLATNQCRILLEYLDSEKVTGNIKREIKARLHLHYAYPLIYGAGGFMDPKISGSIPNALQRIFDDKNELSYADMTFFLRDGSNGMKVDYFWNELMKINYGDGYIKVVNEILRDQDFLKQMVSDNNFWNEFGINNPSDYFSKTFGGLKDESLNPGSLAFREEKSNYQYDSDEVRKKIVDKYLVSKVGSGDDLNKLNKGLELANKLIVATGENATMNSAFAGHDDLAELVLTEPNTYDRKSKGKTIGSRRVMRSLISLTPTWLRAISNKDVMGPLMTGDINYEAMRNPKGTEYFYYTAILMKKTIKYQQAVMQEAIQLRDITSQPYWKDLYDSINKVAKYPSMVIDAKRDQNGNVIRGDDGSEILDVVYNTDGSIDLARSNVMIMFPEPKPIAPPTQVATRQDMNNYNKVLEAYELRKKDFYSKKESRLRELLVEGIVHLNAMNIELGMTATDLTVLGEILKRNVVIRDDIGHNSSVQFLTEKQWKGIYNAYIDAIVRTSAARKEIKRNLKYEQEDVLENIVGQGIKTVLNGK